MLVSEILNKYMAEYLANKSSYRVDKYVHSRLDALYGHLDHTELTIEHLNTYKRQRLTEVATGTVRRELSLIKRAWRYCQSDGVVLTDLFVHFRMPPASPKRRRIPTNRELQTILRYVSPQVHDLILLGIETCCRRNELLGIRREHVDLHSKTLYIPQAKTGPRYVPLSAKAIRILRKNRWHFTIKPSSVSSNIRRVCQRLDIDGLCFHSLTRHTGITRLIERGFSLSETATVSGHADPRTLHSVYTHLNLTTLAKRL